jgi:homoserine dehydrogenase
MFLKGEIKMPDLNLALIGFGNVGQEFCRILIERGRELLELYGFKCNVVAVNTRSKGSLLNKAGVDLNRALTNIKDKGRFLPDNPDFNPVTTAEIITRKDVDLIVEITTLNIENGQPAADHIAGALKNGKNVITANKGPIAFHYHDLKQLAEKEKRCFLFEGAVMDCAPVFNLVRETLPGCRITGFRGILNSTTNYILTEMAGGINFSTALQKAQELGFAEADPALDIEGWDAAAKVAALINVLLDAKITPPEIDRTGIGQITERDLEQARADNRVIRLLCEGYREGSSIHGKVAPAAIPFTDPLAHIEGTASTLTLNTDLAGKITIGIDDPQIRQTAYALLSDLLTIAKNLNC